MFAPLKKGLYAYTKIYIKRESPVLVYAPGRVGSMGLLKNLRDVGIFSFKVESFKIERRGTTQFVKKHIINKKKPAHIISLVRDPVAIMGSYYFSKCSNGWIPDGSRALEKNDIKRLIDIFIEQVLKTERLNSHLYWFENEFYKYTGIDVFEHMFDTDNMFGIVEHELYPTLIIRTELDNTKKAEVINTFLGVKNVTITRENTRNKKDNADLYARFMSQLHIPLNLLEKIYSSPYSQHFFSDAERESLKAKWLQ